MSTVISVEHLSKTYRLGQIGTGTLSRDLNVWWAKTCGKPNPLLRIGETDRGNCHGDELWALRDVSFTVEQGEVLGIIGRNGAGKSTLLKILSRITAPTSGKIKVKGRVASLLEVGTGFHPELTGRENIYLNGAILGMSRKEIDRKFDEIVDFAEVEKFIDTPVKRYSSGMYVRLAFAVAAHLDPEILVVDEVLAVGDAEFQKKCLGKMGEVAKEGRTVLFVSHNMSAIQKLCPQSLWIDSGEISWLGPSSEIIRAYLNQSKGISSSDEMDLSNWTNRYGSGEVRILLARILDGNGVTSATVYRASPMTIEFIFKNQYSGPLHFSIVVKSDSDERILHLSHYDTTDAIVKLPKGNYQARFSIPELPLCSGNYSLVLAIHTLSLMPLDVVSDVLPFTAEDMIKSPRPYRTHNGHAYCWTPNLFSVTPIA